MKAIVTGSNGMLGSAIREQLGESHFYHTRKIADLTSEKETNDMFSLTKEIHPSPDSVIVCSSRVAGLGANIANPASFFEQNVAMDHNILMNAYKHKFENVVTVLSTCMFPADATYPLTKDQIDSGKPHFSNAGYAYAKRLLCHQTRMYREISGKNWISVVPSNMFGPNDNFSLTNSHIIPGLIHKAYLASKSGEDFVIWGTGEPLRQFIFAPDLAEIIIWAIKGWKSSEPLMAIDEKEYSVKYIAELIARKFNIPESRIVFDTSKPDGQFRKPAKSDIPDYKFTPFEEAIDKTIEWFLQNINNIRK